MITTIEAHIVDDEGNGCVITIVGEEQSIDIAKKVLATIQTLEGGTNDN